jgi:butyryl-CoA dehydrogenase
VVDEVVQIYGGYGFVEEYPAERSYRDARVNRIFEGTNEINRMIITGWLMKRAMSGQLALMPAIKQLMDEVLAGPQMGEPLEGALAAERTIIANAKKAGLMVSGVAMQKYMMGLQDQQEIMGAMANMIIEVYAMESAVLRTQKLIASKGEASCETAIAMTRAYISGSIDKVESEAKRVLAACAEGDMLRTQMAILRRLFKYEPLNSIAARQHVADRVIEAGKYVF